MKVLIIGSLVLFGCLNKGLSQSIYTVNKEFNKTIDWSSSLLLKIVSEKATIQVKQGSSDKVGINMRFSASHTDSLIAKQELTYMKHSLSQQSQIVDLRNGFFLPSNVNKIESKLEVFIIIEAPSNINLIIEHKYGAVRLNNLSGVIATKVEYGDIIIEEFNGEMDLDLIYSELKSQEINATKFNCKGHQSKFWFDITGGNFKLFGNYSDFSLKIADINSLEIYSSNSFILLRPEIIEKFNYKLKSDRGALIVPKRFSKEIDPKDDTSISLVIDNQNPTIKARTNFNTIHLETN